MIMNGEYRIILKQESSQYFSLGDFNPLKDKLITTVYVRIYRSLSVIPGIYRGEIMKG